MLFIDQSVIHSLTSLQNVPLQDTNRSLGFLGWGSVCWSNLIASACASHSRHPSAGDKRRQQPSFTCSAPHLSFYCSFSLAHRAGAQRLGVPLHPIALFWRQGLLQKGKRDVWLDEITRVYLWQGLSTLCLCPRLVGELCDSSLTCMATSPSLLLNRFEHYAGVVYSHSVTWRRNSKQNYFGCTQHFVMHVCMIKGYVCSMSVQGVKHIYIYI